jgi:hypothetical protein
MMAMLQMKKIDGKKLQQANLHVPSLTVPRRAVSSGRAYLVGGAGDLNDHGRPAHRCRKTANRVAAYRRTADSPMRIPM